MRFDAQKRGKFVTRIINCRARVAARRVHARWIAEMPAKVRQHRFARCFAQRRRGIVIEVNHRLFPLILVVLVLVITVGKSARWRGRHHQHARACAPPNIIPEIHRALSSAYVFP